MLDFLLLQCGTILGEPDEIQDMGATQIPEDVFQQYLIGLSEKDFRWEFIQNLNVIKGP